LLQAERGGSTMCRIWQYGQTGGDVCMTTETNFTHVVDVKFRHTVI